MKSKSAVLHLSVPNTPPFLIHGHHSHKIWHRVIFHSSKRHENAKTKKVSYRQRFVPSLCALLFLLFSCFKDICRTQVPVKLQNIPVLLRYRKHLFTHWAMKLLLFLSTSPSWPGVEHISTVSLRERCWDASWKSCASKSWNIVYFYFAFLQLQLPLTCFTQLITSSGSQCFTGASTVCPDHPHSFGCFFSVSTFSTSMPNSSLKNLNILSQLLFWTTTLFLICDPFSSFASLSLLYNQCNQFTFSEINCNPREIQS